RGDSCLRAFRRDQRRQCRFLRHHPLSTRRVACRSFQCSHSPHRGEGWGEGLTNINERTVTPHASPLPMGEGTRPRPSHLRYRERMLAETAAIVFAIEYSPQRINPIFMLLFK